MDSAIHKKQKHSGFSTANITAAAVCLLIILSLVFPAAGQSAVTAYDLINAMNGARAANGYSALETDPYIMASAQQTAEQMAAYHMQGHIGDVRSRISAAGYNNGYECWATENWSTGNSSTSIGNIMAAWSDPAHMIPAVNPAYCHIGAGVASASDGTVYYVLQAAYPANKGGCGYLSDREAEANGLTKIETFGYDPGVSQIVIPVETSSPDKDGFIFHTVKQGQTLWLIAKAYDVSVEDLAAWNRVTDETKLYPGEKLLIPFDVNGRPVPTPDMTPYPTMYPDGKFRHVVSEGETIWSIAQRWKVKEADLLAVNGLDYDTVLGVNWKLFIPVTPTPVSIAPTATPAPPIIGPTETFFRTPVSEVYQEPTAQGTLPWLLPASLILLVCLSGAAAVIAASNKSKKL